MALADVADVVLADADVAEVDALDVCSLNTPGVLPDVDSERIFDGVLDWIDMVGTVVFAVEETANDVEIVAFEFALLCTSYESSHYLTLLVLIFKFAL